MIYCGLHEEDRCCNSWDKQTIYWINANEKKVKRLINSVGYGIKRRALCSGDVDDIFSDIRLKLYEKEDYIAEKALGRNNYIITLEDYVMKVARDITMRTILKQIEDSSSIHDMRYKDKDGIEKDDFDKLEDKKTGKEFDKEVYKLKDMLKSYSFKRYKYGIDTYTLLMIRLLTTVCGKDYLYKSSLELLGYDIEHLDRIEKKAFNDEMLLDIIKGITMMDTWDAIELLKQHIHCGQEIVDMIYNA